MGLLVRCPALKCALMTGEFVRIDKEKGRSFIFRIVGVSAFEELLGG